VVIPTFEPSHYLHETLRSVLAQDLGTDRMQIAVVDDASPTCDVKSLIEQIAPRGRVELHLATQNRGLSGNWNESLRIARGETVHILHQDDWVADGFYRRLLPVFSDPAVGMAFCRHAFIDGKNQITRFSHCERWRPGLLDDWLGRITQQQRIQCASALVRRKVYEQLGGYRSDLRYALDWEMWVRVAAKYRVWYEPRILASYRRHDSNETSRLRNEGRIGLDIVKTIETFAQHLPVERRSRLVSAAYESFAEKTLKRIESQVRQPAGAAIDVHSLLEPVRVAATRITDPTSDIAKIEKRIAQLAHR
jgi:GT2 family glycosyltransferase